MSRKKKDSPSSTASSDERELPRLCVPEDRELDDIVDAYMMANENTEPPKNYHLWVALSCLSAALQRRCWLDWFSLRIYPNLYVALVGPPGATRKGTALSFGRELLSAAQIPRCADATTRAAFIQSLERCRSAFIYGDQIHEHCSMTAFSSELTVLLGHNDKLFLDNLTDLFDCGDYFEYDTKTQGRNTMSNVWLSLLGATTQGALRAALPEHAFSGGFLSRFIAVCESKKYKHVACPERSPEEHELWSLVKRDYPRLLNLAGSFAFDESYREAYVAWYAESAENPPFRDPKLDAYTSRRPLHLWKLSMLSSASRSNDMQLTSFDFERARDWLAAAEYRMPQAFSGLGKHQLAEILKSMMGFIGTMRATTVGELMKLHHEDITYDDLEKMLQTLQAMNFVTVVKSPVFAATKVILNETSEVQHERAN